MSASTFLYDLLIARYKKEAMEPVDPAFENWDINKLRLYLSEEVPNSFAKQFPQKSLPFSCELVEGICEEHLDFLAELFQLEDHRRYITWYMAFTCINGDFLQRDGRYKIAKRMIGAMEKWVAKGIPQEPLFLLLANAYDYDQSIGRTGNTIKEEMVDYNRKQKERIKSAGGDVNFLSRRVFELENRLNEVASDETKARIFAQTLKWIDEVGLISNLRELQQRASRDGQSLSMIRDSVIPQDGKPEHLAQEVITCAIGILNLMEKHVGVRSPSEVVDLLWEWGIEINPEIIKKRAN